MVGDPNSWRISFWFALRIILLPIKRVSNKTSRTKRRLEAVETRIIIVIVVFDNDYKRRFLRSRIGRARYTSPVLIEYG